MTKTAKIIVLNGTSSSGKTTLVSALQAISSEVYLHCSLDAFWDMTPCNVPAGSKNFPNMKLAIAKSVKALVETGHNVIVDIVFCGEKTYLEFNSELAQLNVKFVKVDCSLSELVKRELARGDRAIGLAQSQFESIHQGVKYDMVVNINDNSPEQCAQDIISCFCL